MSSYKIEDFNIILKDRGIQMTLKNGKYDVFTKVTNKEALVENIITYLKTGSRRHLWNTGDYEEPCTRLYFFLDNEKACGVIISSLDVLVHALHSKHKLYTVDIWDNLI